MRLFFAFIVRLVLLIPAVVVADWTDDELSPNLVESPSEPGNSNQVLRLDDSLGSESIAGTSADCALDHVQFPGKLRARLSKGECQNPENSGKNGNNDNSKKPQQFSDFELIWRPPNQLEPMFSDLCPPDLNGRKQRIICHEGPENEITGNGAKIVNAFWCKLFFFSKY